MQKNLNKNLNRQNLPQGVNPQMIDRVLNWASQKLGCSPDQLREKLQNGEFEAAVKNSEPASPQMAKLKQMLNDPKAADKIMNDPKAAEILKKLNSK